MPIKLLRGLTLLCMGVIFQLHVTAQTIWENPKSEAYPFLTRMANKGLIQFNDLILPVSRKTIYEHLRQLQQISSSLTSTEKKELAFYLQEYSRAYHTIKDTSNISFFKKDAYGRFRSFTANEHTTTLQVDPIIGMGYIGGSDKAVKQYSSGVDIWGTIGSHWGFQIYFRDFNETGTGFDTLTQNTPNTGIIRKDISNHKSLNYSETRAAITYTWKKGIVSIGQDHLQWGYGQNGLIVLSDKSPVFPYIRFDYQLFKWLHFNYAHIWLNSNIIDSGRTYATGNTVYGGQRTYFQPKYMAIHSVNITLKKGLTAAIGESMIYNDRIQIPYLIPILFYKIYDYESTNSNNMSGSNSQIFFNINSRNQIPKTQLYGTVFIDEISVTNFFNTKKRRNQLGYTIGIEKNDLFIPYFSMGVEYTRVNPFVYRNFIPAEDYTNHGYYLGDWMGNNFDRIIVTAKYHPIAKLSLMARFQYSRKGGPGNLIQQYFVQPQPSFLFDLQNKTTEFYFQAKYEWLHRLYINAIIQQLHSHDAILNTNNIANTLQLGISYGL